MPNSLWGKAIRHATYLLNMILTRVLNDQTPHEVFRSKKPNIQHLRIFGCIGYAQVENVHLKKLDDRSHMLVHLGTEPGSKAYRLLDPERQKIVVSRDVVFDESKIWNWNRDETDHNGDFNVTLGEFGNHGIEGICVENDQFVTEAITDNGEPIVKVPEEEKVEGESSEDVAEEIPLQRSERQVVKPKYLEDYVLLAEEEGEKLLLILNGKPEGFEEARKIT